MRVRPFLLVGVLGLLSADARADDAKKHTLRYKFSAGETLRWNVEHRAKIRTTVGGVTQTADTASDSVKVWKVEYVDEQGHATFTHLVESVRMRHELTGREPMTYDSEKDKKPPQGFEDAAKNVGVPLTRITLDPLGNVLKREDKRPQPGGERSAPMTILLPEEPVAVGDSWKHPYEITVQRQNRTVKHVKSQQRYTLKRVSADVATIEVETIILTPVHDPNVEAQLVQRETRGEIRFDVAAGRVIGQRLELDKRVVGAPSGDASSMHYVMEFEETLERETPQTARPRVYGPLPNLRR